MIQKKQGRSYIMAVLGILLAIAADQYTKYLAVIYLKDQPSISVWKDVFELTYVENRGAAFGILEDQTWFFVLTGIIIFALIIFLYTWIPKTRKYLPLRICGIFIFAGAAGNLIDRSRLGYVVDFFYFKPIDFPVFNVADIYITVSFAALIILIFFVYKEEDLACKRKKKEQ